MADVRPYSAEAYREIVSRLRSAGWHFASFLDEPPREGRAVYLRHDVDYSLELAVELAELNSELGVRGTFFVQVSAELYNLFAPRELERLHRLGALGQGIALHYERLEEGPRAEDVRECFDVLRSLEPDAEPVFSWHRPVQGLLDAPLEVPGLVNVYGERFFQDMPYLSDSTHRHSVGELAEALGRVEGAELQLLLHPVNWIAGGSSGLEILIRGWLRVLRDHESTLLENRTFVERFPNGLPQSLFEDFERDLLAASRSLR